MSERLDAAEQERSLRELALIDKVIGLEAEVARLSAIAGARDIRVMQNSQEWKLGRKMLAPVRLLKKMLGKS